MLNVLVRVSRRASKKDTTGIFLNPFYVGEGGFELEHLYWKNQEMPFDVKVVGDTFEYE